MRGCDHIWGMHTLLCHALIILVRVPGCKLGLLQTFYTVTNLQRDELCVKKVI